MLKRNDAANGRALSEMNVGHDRDVPRDYRKTGDVADLIDRVPFDRKVSGPGLYVSDVDLVNKAAHKQSPHLS